MMWSDQVTVPRLMALVRRAEGRRLVTVTAGPGWGKTWFAQEWAQATGSELVRLPRGTVDAAGLVAAISDEDPSGASTADGIDRICAAGGTRLVIDDVHRLDPSGHRLLAELAQRMRRPLLLTSRTVIPMVDADLRAQGEVLEFGAPQLRLDSDEVGSWVSDDFEDEALATRIGSVTSGWPAAIRLVIDALHDYAPGQRAAAVHEIASVRGALGRFLRAVVDQEDASTRRLLTQIALTEPTDAARLTNLTGDERVCDQIASLTARGLILADPATGQLTLPARLADIVQGTELNSGGDGAALVREVIDVLIAEDRIADALEALTRLGRVDQIVEMLTEHGESLIGTGEIRAVCRAVERVPVGQRSHGIERVHAWALAFSGERAAALRCLETAGALGDGPLPAALGLVLGNVHHLRGELEQAIEAYARVSAAEGDPNWAATLAWRSTAHWARGEPDAAKHWAEQALGLAEQLGDDRCLALAHTALAMVAAGEGDRRANGLHYDHALEAATRAGDAVQRSRLLNNLGSRHLENGDYERALEYTEEAISLAESCGFSIVAGIARCNRAEIHNMTGAIDEAVVDAEVARDVFARIGSRMEAYAHRILGDARREQGNVVQARLAYEQALQLADPTGDQQSTVPALIGLSRSLAASAPDLAQDAARRAIAADGGMSAAECQLALAWSDLAAGDMEAAGAAASDAWDEAQRRANRPALAEAVTLQAVLADDPVPGLREAAQLWWEVDDPITATRVELGIARRRATESVRAATLERTLLDWGCKPEGGTFVDRMVAGTPDLPPLAIRALGPFVVERQGTPLPRSAWRSRKARDLLKVLIVRGDRQVTREEAAHLLWPDEPYSDVSNRLSVALSLLRSALSVADAVGDSPEAPLITEGDRIGLDLHGVDLDVDRFRRAAEAGLAAIRAGRQRPAQESLTIAEELYVGDLLEEDRYVTWIDDARDELSSLYLSVTRTLASLVAVADPERALRLWLRVLDRDPYDEEVHHAICRALVRAGRHGEARRRHRLYANRMAELELPAVPLADITRHRRAAS